VECRCCFRYRLTEAIVSENQDTRAFVDWSARTIVVRQRSQSEPQVPLSSLWIEPSGYVGGARLGCSARIAGFLGALHVECPLFYQVRRRSPRGFVRFRDRLVGRIETQISMINRKLTLLCAAKLTLISSLEKPAKIIKKNIHSYIHISEMRVTKL
jgi:hypothetical protein